MSSVSQALREPPAINFSWCGQAMQVTRNGPTGIRFVRRHGREGRAMEAALRCRPTVLTATGSYAHGSGRPTRFIRGERHDVVRNSFTQRPPDANGEAAGSLRPQRQKSQTAQVSSASDAAPPLELGNGRSLKRLNRHLNCCIEMTPVRNEPEFSICRPMELGPDSTTGAMTKSRPFVASRRCGTAGTSVASGAC